jgi:hypothetical protein
MRLKDILGGMDPSQFVPELLLPGTLKFFSQSFRPEWIIPLEKLEDYIKNLYYTSSSAYWLKPYESDTDVSL